MGQLQEAGARKDARPGYCSSRRRGAEGACSNLDEVSTKVLDPIPNLNHDATRREIDEAFMKVLQLPDVRVVAELLAREPIVANSRIQPAGASNNDVDAPGTVGAASTEFSN